MSFFLKLKTLFQKNTEIQFKPSEIDLIIQKILYPSYQNERNLAKQNIIELLQNDPIQIELFMNGISKLQNPPKNDAFYCLLEIFQILLNNDVTQEFIATELKQQNFKCFSTESAQQNDQERLNTEASTSSFLPPQYLNNYNRNVIQSNPLPRNTCSKDQINEKRKNRIEMNNNLNELENKPAQKYIAPKIIHITSEMFIKIYYQYLQKVATNLDLIKAITAQQYPFTDDSKQLEPMMKFLWLYKIQNLINLAINLLDQFQPTVSRLQETLWIEVVTYQNFLVSEISKLSSFKKILFIDEPNLLSQEGNLQLYEIHYECQINHQVLKNFQKIQNQALGTYQLIAPPKIEADQLNQLQRNKIMNQYAIKRNIKQQERVEIIDTNLSHFRQKSGCPILNFNHANNFVHKENFGPTNINIHHIIQKPIPESINQSIEPLDNNHLNQMNYEMNYERQVALRVLTEKFDSLPTNECSILEDQ